MKEIAKAHGAKISATTAKVSHIIEVDPNQPNNTDDELDYLRTLEKREKISLIHWWYYPDSYDIWIPSHEVEVTYHQHRYNNTSTIVVPRYLLVEMKRIGILIIHILLSSRL